MGFLRFRSKCREWAQMMGKLNRAVVLLSFFGLR
jgi:hypothetical protein